MVQPQQPLERVLAQLEDPHPCMGSLSCSPVVGGAQWCGWALECGGS